MYFYFSDGSMRFLQTSLRPVDRITSSKIFSRPMHTRARRVELTFAVIRTARVASFCCRLLNTTTRPIIVNVTVITLFCGEPLQQPVGFLRVT